MKRKISHSIPQNAFLNQQHIASSSLDFLNHSQNVITLLLQNPIHLSIIGHNNILLDIGFGGRNLELNHSNLGILDSGRTTRGMADFLIKNQTPNHLGIVNSPAQFLNDLNIPQIYHIRLTRIHNIQNSVNGKGGKQGRVLAYHFTVERSAGALHQRIPISELHGYGHGRQNLDGLLGRLVERL
eukprot:Gb_12957 [translate_table: standard]